MVPLNSQPGNPPPNYNEVTYWKITEGSNRLIQMNLLSIPLAIVFGIGFYIFVQWFGGSPELSLGESGFWIFLIGIVVVLAVHELVHGVLMRSFGAKPRYGFFGRGLMFYAKAPGYAFKRNQYLIIVLGPIISLSIISCLGIIAQSGSSMVWVWALWAIINASAAGADLWITALVRRYPSSAVIVDEMDGMRVLLPQNGRDGE